MLGLAQHRSHPLVLQEYLRLLKLLANGQRVDICASLGNHFFPFNPTKDQAIAIEIFPNLDRTGVAIMFQRNHGASPQINNTGEDMGRVACGS